MLHKRCLNVSINCKLALYREPIYKAPINRLNRVKFVLWTESKWNLAEMYPRMFSGHCRLSVPRIDLVGEMKKAFLHLATSR